MNDANDLLQNKINVLEVDLKKLYIKENEFLNLHKNYLSYFKQDNFTERCLKEIN
jgi:hypothetical protein